MRTRNSLAGAAVAAALLLGACADTDSSATADADTATTGSAEATTTVAPTTAPPTTMPPTTAPTTTAAPVATTPEPLECPEPSLPQLVYLLNQPREALPPPVDPALQSVMDFSDEPEAFDPFSGPTRSEELGVAFVFEPPFPMGVIEHQDTDFQWFGTIPGTLEFNRPGVIYADEGLRRVGVPSEILTFDQWIERWGEALNVVEDFELEVDGNPARAIVFQDPDFGTIEETDDFGIGGWHVGNDFYSHLERTLIVEIDLGDVDPLYVHAHERQGGQGDWADQILGMLQTMQIGDAVATEPIVFGARNHWDVGNPSEVMPGDCELPTLAFGGSTFELLTATKMSGSGDQLWFLDETVASAGTMGPAIDLAAPVSVRGEPDRMVDGIDAALGRYEELGWQLSEIGPTSMAGNEATRYSFRLDEGIWIDGIPAVLWELGGHEGSEALPLGFPDFIEGEIVMSETSRGLLVATLWGEVDTGDAELLRDRFEHLVATLTFAE